MYMKVEGARLEVVRSDMKGLGPTKCRCFGQSRLEEEDCGGHDDLCLSRFAWRSPGIFPCMSTALLSSPLNIV